MMPASSLVRLSALAIVVLAAAVSAKLAAATGDKATEPAVTYASQIARLFQQHCQHCHRAGDVAPFALDSYTTAYRERRKILRAVETRKMPPWKPVPGFGDIVGSRRLSDADVRLVRAWVDAGAPEGDAHDLPAPRTFPETWSRGEPDAVIAPSEAFEVPAGRDDLYRCFVIPTRFAEDRYLSAVEFVPGNREIVHPLIWIDDLDFHWPGGYTFARPVPMPAGTRIDVEAIYDNSPRNKKNPHHPPQAARWGEGTTDEMCIAFIRVTVDAETLGHEPRYAAER